MPHVGEHNRREIVLFDSKKLTNVLSLLDCRHDNMQNFPSIGPGCLGECRYDVRGICLRVYDCDQVGPHWPLKYEICVPLLKRHNEGDHERSYPLLERPLLLSVWNQFFRLFVRNPHHRVHHVCHIFPAFPRALERIFHRENVAFLVERGEKHDAVCLFILVQTQTSCSQFAIRRPPKTHWVLEFFSDTNKQFGVFFAFKEANGKHTACF
mmetsp:Transcript_12812/g.25301  ORF Transcript_12812/g.25301 Transcript_12812/m.25301 type:complete len:210 (-) Transcript_12812:551-1180(-)